MGWVPRFPLVLRVAIVACWCLAAGGLVVNEGRRTVAADVPEMGMRRGVNLGNALEAPYEGAWGVVLREEYFPLLKEAGFDTVRVPVKWSGWALPDHPYTISEHIFKRVEWVIEQSLSQGLTVIINMHHYDEITKDPDLHRDRFVRMWDQIARRFAHLPPQVLFEPLNEPSGGLSAARWNDLFADVLAVIRATNPGRWVVVGPVDWNHVRALPSLALPPEDRRLLVTFHYYEPFWFTHQGAEWVTGSGSWLGTHWIGTESERRAIERDFDGAVAWAAQEGRPLFLGEFGAYSKADLGSRVRWTAFVARVAEARGIPWAYWEFGAGFGIYDIRTRQWREDLLRALVPPPGSP